MMKTFGWAAVATMVPVLVAGCVGDNVAPQGEELVGTASLALTGVPADGTCIVITAAGNRTVTRAIDAAAGSSMVVPLSGLPVGPVRFSATAFGATCAARGTMPANWVSDADFETTLAVAPAALVTLNLVRNGMASVSVGFDDGAPTPDGGSNGGAGSGGAGSPGTAAEGLFFMKVDGVSGDAAELGQEGAFTLDDFVLAVANTSTLVGGGAGAGKATWLASAKLKFQKGTPELYLLATRGTHVKNVVVTAKKKKDGKKQEFLIVTMNDILISGVQSTGSGDVPNLAVDLVFGDIKIELKTELPDGSAGPSVLVTWDLKRNTGGSGVYPFDFIVGGPAVAPVKAITSFHAPSEQTAGTVAGGGGGAGKPQFSDASVALPIDADVLKYIAATAAGRVAATGSVEIDTTGPSGPAPFGKYGFKNVALHGVTLSGLNADVSFAAAAYSWTTFGPGGTTTTFDVVKGM